jgi:hypothetical protein
MGNPKPKATANHALFNFAANITFARIKYTMYDEIPRCLAFIPTDAELCSQPVIYRRPQGISGKEN